MKVYRLTVHLYEGDDVNLGIFATEEAAQNARTEAMEDWADGPNVESVTVVPEELK